jgi:excisionase family DNA binding protein
VKKKAYKKTKSETELVNPGDMLTIEQVGAFLSVSDKTVRRMLDQGLVSIKFRRRRYVYKATLVNYINTHKAA